VVSDLLLEDDLAAAFTAALEAVVAAFVKAADAMVVIFVFCQPEYLL
jgi:hypothetical protein